MDKKDILISYIKDTIKNNKIPLAQLNELSRRKMITEYEYNQYINKMKPIISVMIKKIIESVISIHINSEHIINISFKKGYISKEENVSYLNLNEVIQNSVTNKVIKKPSKEQENFYFGIIKFIEDNIPDNKNEEDYNYCDTFVDVRKNKNI